MGLSHAVIAQEGPPGITRPVVFPPFDPNAPTCMPPAGLRKVLAFAQDNERKFMQGVGHGLELAACSPSATMRQIEGLHEGRISGSS
jgi:ribose transport system substrate-binding protein